MIDDVKMHMTSFMMMPYDVICGKLLIDSNRCIYHTNSSYLAAYTNVKCYKKQQSKIWGLLDHLGELTALAMGKIQKNISTKVTPVDLINTRAKK